LVNDWRDGVTNYYSLLGEQAMTNDEIKVAIAEWIGWKNIQVCHRNGGRWLKGSLYGENPQGYLACVPNFAGDLNAIHEAEKKLKSSKDLWAQYTTVMLPWLASSHAYGFLDGDTVHATAHQRSEALLKTIGKWKD
jgi:hypothetical protein